MGIDNVAIKTFNSTGSQSVCRANEADETKLIESEFLTKCTTQYINGSGMSFIPGTIDKSKLLESGPNETFTIPSDVDAISEITLQMGFGNDASGVSETFILDIIRKIEVKLGNLIVQTILPCDIYARNLTESGNLINVSTYHDASNNLYNKNGSGRGPIDFSISIPFTGRSAGVNKSFLQAGAITNNLKIKVYYNKLSTGQATGGGILQLAAKYPTTITSGICVFSHSITHIEKNFIAKNVINRPVNTSQTITYPLTSITSSSKDVTIDLSPVNINVSHILLTLNNSIFNSAGVAIDASSGHTPTGTTWTAISDGLLRNSNLGVATGWLKSVELILGNDRTGNIPGSCLTTNSIELFKLTSVQSKNIYLLKLAGSAFSTAGVPFSRLNNKKLIINYADNFTAASYTDGVNTGMTNINVTCCGTQIQSTVGGTISFSA
jgi:hypothetical protein